MFRILRLFFTCLILCLGLCLGQMSWANDASFRGDGATVYTTKDSRIRMAKETIRLTYVKVPKSKSYWTADCVFEFENLSDQTVTLTMGFPNWKGFGDGVDSNQFVIKKFSTQVDDKVIEPELKEISKKNQVGPWIKSKKLATFEGAYVWPVTFQPKAKVVVKNTFEFGGFVSNGPFNAVEDLPATYPKVKKSHTFWSVRKPGKKDIDFANALVGAVAYITTTGQTWAGPIGEATIIFDLPQEMQNNPHFLIPLPQGYHMQKDKITWHFTNYLPREEITLYYIAHVFVPEDILQPGQNVDDYPVGFQYPAQAKAWVQFASKSRVDVEISNRLIEITGNPQAKKILEGAKLKLAQKK